MGIPTRAAFSVHHKGATTNDRLKIAVAVTARSPAPSRQTDRNEWTLFWFGFVTPRPTDGRTSEGNNEGPVEKRIPTTATTRRCSHCGGGVGGSAGLKQKAADADRNTYRKSHNIGVRVACSRFLPASGRGGEFTQPLPPILWNLRYKDSRTYWPCSRLRDSEILILVVNFLT